MKADDFNYSPYVNREHQPTIKHFIDFYYKSKFAADVADAKIDEYMESILSQKANVHEALSTTLLDADKAKTWPENKKALWDVIINEKLNDGHYIRAFDLVEKLYNALPKTEQTDGGFLTNAERDLIKGLTEAAKSKDEHQIDELKDELNKKDELIAKLQDTINLKDEELKACKDRVTYLKTQVGELVAKVDSAKIYFRHIVNHYPSSLGTETARQWLKDVGGK